MTYSLVVGGVITLVLGAGGLPAGAGGPVVSPASQVYKVGDADVTAPRVVREVKPSYTAGAMRAGIQGSVFLTVVVLANGEVGDVTVQKSLDREHGLDEAAVEAARQWRFTPGTRKGEAVPVEVTLQLTFTLKK